MTIGQVAFTSIDKSVAHVSIAAGLGDPGALFTACGLLVESWGDFLSARMSAWPDGVAPWCQQCRDARATLI